MLSMSGIFGTPAGGRHAHGSPTPRPRSSYASQTDFVAEAVSNQSYLLYIFRKLSSKRKKKGQSSVVEEYTPYGHGLPPQRPRNAGAAWYLFTQLKHPCHSIRKQTSPA